MDSFNVMFYQQSPYFVTCEVLVQKQGTPIGFSEAVRGLFLVRRVYWMS